jgi:hypothetical protein
VAASVSAVEVRIGRDEMFALLADVGRGARFEDVYRERTGETVDTLIGRLIGVAWTLSAFAPNRDVHITIYGASYELAFTVRTDAIGLYRGIFGSTAARARTRSPRRARRRG